MRKETVRARRRAVYLETASLIGQRMTTITDLNALLTEIVSLIGEKLGYYHTHLFLVDEQAGELVLKEASGPSADLMKARSPRLKIREQGITGWVAHTAQSSLCNDVSQEPRYYPTELLPETRAELAVPITAGNRVIGVLDVQSDRRDAFTKEDEALLQIVGNQVATAIENLRLFQETRRRYEAMMALHETSLDMITQLDRKEVLEGLLRRGVQLLGAEAGSLFLYDAAQGLIRNIANHNTWRDWTGATLRPDKGVISQVVTTGNPLVVNGYDTWPQKSDVFVGPPGRGVIGVPLRWRDQVIGGIIVLNLPQRRPFDDNDVWLLSLFADLATIAIKNAELHTQVKEFSQGLEREVRERTLELSRAKEEIAVRADQLRALLAKTVRLQEEERARVARDMHDGVMQLITAARYELKAARVVAGSGLTGAAEEKLSAAHEVLDEMEQEIRRAIYNLHPPILDAVGLAPALKKYVSRFQELWGIDCNFEVTGTPRRLMPAQEIAIYRMVEEALHNVATHAGAEKVSIHLDFGGGTFCAAIRDNGDGFDQRRRLASPGGSGLGLLGMQERITNLGGTLELWSDPGRGTQVVFRLPYSATDLRS